METREKDAHYIAKQLAKRYENQPWFYGTYVAYVPKESRWYVRVKCNPVPEGYAKIVHIHVYTGQSAYVEHIFFQEKGEKNNGAVSRALGR